MSEVVRAQLSTRKEIAFASITLVLCLLLLEVAVRVSGLADSCPDENPGGQWACDPILYFKPNPAQRPGGQPMNRADFRTHEFTPKPPGIYRILSLGDSCTFGIVTTTVFEYIPEPYPARLERMVAERAGAGKVEVLNAGVAGYTSFQGVMLLRTKLRGLHPGLITVRYGWNDHFMGAMGPGHSFREPEGAFALAAQDLLLRTKLYPFVKRLDLEIQALHPPPKPSIESIPKEWKPTVPLEQYKHNLRRMVELGRSQGAAVWLLTSPHAFLIDSNRGHYDQFRKTFNGQSILVWNAIPTFERLIEIHESYNAATREVGAELGVPVVDMDAIYRQHASEPLFTAYDIPHPTQEGHNLEAEALYERLLAEGIVKPGVAAGSQRR
jgi:lysophospholipase L1-like esterase